MVQTPDKEQKEFFITFYIRLKPQKPLSTASSVDGAGVGKSHLTKDLYQAVLKYYNTRAGDDFHQIKVILLAPTGKA